jgi:hypothetical protein
MDQMRALQAGIIAAVLSGLSFPGFAQDTVPWSTTAEWPVIVDPALGNGCFTSMAYATGTVLRIGFNRLASQGYVLIASKAWSSLQRGSGLDLRLIFGSAQPWDLTGTVINLDGTPALWVNFINVGVIFDFMQQPDVQIWQDDQMLDQLSLTGSSDAFSEVMRCQEAMDAKSASNS